nr:hypothetical protein [Tanacetum cinerariifolium]
MSPGNVAGESTVHKKQIWVYRSSPPLLTTTSSHHHHHDPHHHSTRPLPLDTSRVIQDVARDHGGDGGRDDRPPPYEVPTGCGGCLGNRDVTRGHDGDGGGGEDDRPPPYQVPTGCGGCLGNRGKGTRKLNLGGRRAGRQHTRQETQNLGLKAITDKSTRQETRNLGLKAITDKNGPILIRFGFGNRETLMPHGDHAAHWANYLGELIRELPLHYLSWCQMSPKQKAGVLAKIV